MLLVGASFILTKKCILEHDSNVADIMLRCFVREIGPLYDWSYYTYNVHNLLHLALYVKRWGPFWVTSTFPFEDFNRVLASCLRGTKNLGKELINNIKIS